MLAATTQDSLDRLQEQNEDLKDKLEKSESQAVELTSG
jgi:hypothetical protein